MKFQIQTEEYPSTHTVDGVTVPITRTRRVATPRLPRDLDAIAERSVVSVVTVLTLVSITWSTVSIAHLLHSTWSAYLAGGVFDLAWLAVLGMSYIVRFRPDRRKVIDWVGWGLLVVTVAAILLEGLQTGGVAFAIVGSTVSLIAKTLWWSLNRATRPQLSPDDAQWVAAQDSAASAELAVASINRKVGRVRDHAAAQMMALESSRRPPVGTELRERTAEDAFTQASLTPPRVPEASPAETAASPIHATVEVDQEPDRAAHQAAVPPPPPAVELPPAVEAGSVLADTSPAAVRAWLSEQLELGTWEEPDLTLAAAERFGIAPRTAQLRKKEVKDARAARQVAG